MASLINVNNDNSAEVKMMILLANRGFYGLKRQFRSQFVSPKTKLKLCELCPYPDQTSTGRHVQLKHGYYPDVTVSLGVPKSKMLRAIFGPTNDNGEWRIRYNNELYTLYKENKIATYIKISRLRSAGQVI